MPELPEDPEALPLRRAWAFLEGHGLGEEAQAIRVSQERFGSYTSTLKRGKIVALLREKGLLEQFVAEHWPNGATDWGKRLIERYARVYQRFLTDSPEEEEEGEEDFEATLFAYEAHLRDYLAKNLYLIEAGLSLWPEPGDARAVEFPVDDSGRRVDILARDAEGKPVVIELKVSRGHERTIGQALYYRGRIKEKLSAAACRIVVVAREISPELVVATADLPDVSLFQYRLSCTLDKIR